MTKVKDGFYHQINSTIGSDDYVLLAGGGTKAVSYFATSSSLSNYVLKAGDTMTGALTISPTSAITPLILNGGTASSGAYSTIQLKTNARHYRTFGVKGAEADLFVTNADGWSNEYLIWHAGNYTTWLNTTNYPGLNKTGTVTSITLKAGAGISLDVDNTAITTSGTRTITNSGVRSVTTSTVYLNVNTNGTTASLLVPQVCGGYDYTNGFLLQTAISEASKPMVFAIIEGQLYHNTDYASILTYIQFYKSKSAADDAVFDRPHVMHYGTAINNIKAFCYNGYLYIWFTQPYRYTTIKARVYTSNNTTINNALQFTDSAMPDSGVTCLTEITNSAVGITSNNYTSYVNNYYWANVKISTTANYGTTPYVAYILFRNTANDADAGYVGRGSSSRNDIQLHARAGNKLELGANNAVGMTFDTSNNVGIGTASPGYKLDVTGTGHFTLNLATTSGQNNGINVGDAQIRQAASGDFEILGCQIRFSTVTDWAYNKWAGLKYDSSNKIIYLGLADGSIFTKQSSLNAETGGILSMPGIDVINFNNTTRFYVSSSGTTTNTRDCNNMAYSGLWYYTSNGPATSLGASTTDGALYSQAYSTSWVGQIAQDYRNGRLFIRGKNNGTWTSWLKVLDTGNYTSYLGYIGTTAVQASSAAQEMTGIKWINDVKLDIFTIPSKTSGTAGWYRLGRIKGHAGYLNVTLYISGTWNTGAPTEALIHMSACNTTPYLTFLSGYRGNTTAVRLVSNGSGEFYFDAHLTGVASDAVRGVQYYILIGNYVINERCTSTSLETPIAASSDTSGTILNLTASITGINITTSNKDSYTFPPSAHTHNYT